MRKAILFGLTSFLMNAGCAVENDNGKCTTLLLQRNFRGRVVIVKDSDAPIGKEIKKLRIPSCGFLRLRDDLDAINRSCRIFLMEQANTIDTIGYYDGDLNSVSENDKARLVVFKYGVGGFSFDDGVEYEAIEFFVDTLKNASKYHSFRIDQEKFNDCR